MKVGEGEEDGRDGQTYAAVETQRAIVLEDVDKGVEHALRAIGGACLKADLVLLNLALEKLEVV